MVSSRLRAMGLNLSGPGAPPEARPGWEDRLVAQKPPMGDWTPEAAPRIAAARACHDAGTHEMVTFMTPSRWTQLYLVARRQPAGQRDFFVGIEAA